MPVSMKKSSDLVVEAAEEIAAAVYRTEAIARTARLAQITDTEAQEQYAAFRRQAESLTRQDRATFHAHGRHDLVGVALADVMRERREFG
ncbi:hypothetical protein ACFCWY_08610 [Streptomyces sp. NPDC056362]|uniref:hypothetical protein n=1 Tax=unclassified Streptomyces TaxID=2593676 RepID=UPI0035E25C05